MKNLLLVSIITFLFISFTNAQSRKESNEKPSTDTRFELKINPVGSILQHISPKAEFFMDDSWGIEVIGYFSKSNSIIPSYYEDRTKFGLTLLGKKYLSPSKRGHDGFYIGGYGRYNQNNISRDISSFGGKNDSYTESKISFGFTSGFKWVSKKNVILELGVGAGRILIKNTNQPESDYDIELGIWDKIDGFFRLDVGYRF